MKTYNNLWEKFISKENFEIALHDSQLGKKKQRQVITFNKNPEVNLEKIRQDVINGRFHTSPYKTMIVFEPKKRVIYKLPYNPDRIVQHAVMNILRPIMEGLFIYDSYACVEGKGQMRASRRCSQFLWEELRLTYSKAFVFDTKQGVDFCGYRTFGKYVLLRKSTAKRVKRRVLKIYPKYTEEKRQASIASTLGWLKHCNSYNLKVKLGLI